MTRYFFHLRDSTGEILDPEGVEILAEDVASAALLSARDCMAGDVKDGCLDLRYRIDVHDESGDLVYSQTFSDALEIAEPI